MKEYQRNTKSCNFSDLHTETIASFKKYFEKNDLGNVETEIILCCETTSTKIKPGLFGKLFGGGNFAQNTIIFFTPNRLFWGSTDQKDHITILSAKLKEIEIKDFNSNLIEDNGLEIFGFLNDSPKRVQAFIGFGEEPFADEFRKRLKETALN
ncbi:MAG TPA: hypothetical protein PKY82_02780 [Pyrinomonadaceae bacterium]|nr:hypothetical protein [Pyrinomonadaceae bacterium]